jgi:hypothetical protein
MMTEVILIKSFWSLWIAEFQILNPIKVCRQVNPMLTDLWAFLKFILKIMVYVLEKQVERDSEPPRHNRKLH